ncbi:hypothetical protein SERLADRAFT_434109 [Serpula lacrymans var. lacrymans S7.9]|uniref:Uncharacterized protein n=2 Tax=Serpula lacrymans var. lacrymans TaxID=341189 RepID=F8NJM3_SERL9|nr:uncharacterized protein SERLADRAFT_434109 [Serpula lacrymans var. lacrymans S7.9]EGO28238.1 hypothetical protein SERLADRAFT_434109 [Serpula lacrymans var. lacrymans S7.9]
MTLVPNVGQDADMLNQVFKIRIDKAEQRKKVAVAHDLIYKKNYAVNSNKVNGFLMAESLVPTLNAFSHRLGPLGFNVYSMFVVNFMHEVELGVWKSLLSIFYGY